MLDDRPIPVYGDGSARRDFTFIDDLVEGLVRGLDRIEGFRIINFGGGTPVTVLDVVRALEEALGREAEIDWQPQPAGDVSQTWSDPTLARSLLDYTPRVSLREGVGRFVAWLNEREKDSV